ncbi:MAG: undecaprenyl-diphosphate phosphatase [Actinomycetota bacterium]|nr:undecaprenyl-diphosphate phosphatase [Actinomycetota bacterium]
MQGATEFAPISSSGHLILVPWLFGWTSFSGDPDLAKTFDVALHMGTLAGALIYFWRDVARYVGAWFRSVRARRVDSADERIAWFLVIGTIPGVIVGALAESFIQQRLGEPWLIAVMLAVFGVVLYMVDRRATRTRDLPDLRIKDALLIGMAQAVALQPGVSRSGVTMTMARGVGLDRPAAARFSFLLSLPIIAGAGVFKAVDLFTEGLPPGTGAAFLWGIVASAVSGFVAIWGLLAYLRRRDFAPFVWYRLVAAAVVLGVIAAGVRPASGL